MDGEEIPTCGEGQHDWKMNENKETECEVCYAIADADFVFGHMDYLEVDNNNHSRKLDDALKAAREAPKAQDIVCDNLDADIKEMNAAIRSAVRVGDKSAIGITMEEAPKITTQPRLLVEISDDENVLQQYEE